MARKCVFAKASFANPEDQIGETMWFQVTHAKGSPRTKPREGMFCGRLANTPVQVTRIRHGSKVCVPATDLLDAYYGPCVVGARKAKKKAKKSSKKKPAKKSTAKKKRASARTRRSARRS